MTYGWLRFVRLRLPEERAEMADRLEVDALRGLVIAQADMLDEFRRMLLEEKRVSRDVAKFAVAVADQELEPMAEDLHRQLADRVARAEEHHP